MICFWKCICGHFLGQVENSIWRCFLPISSRSFCAVVAAAAAAATAATAAAAVVVVVLSYFIFVKCPKNTQSHTACRIVCVLVHSITATDIVLKGCPKCGRGEPKLTRLMVSNAMATAASASAATTTYSKRFFFLLSLMLTPFGYNSPLSFVSGLIPRTHRYDMVSVQRLTWNKISTRSK